MFTQAVKASTNVVTLLVTSGWKLWIWALIDVCTVDKSYKYTFNTSQSHVINYLIWSAFCNQCIYTKYCPDVKQLHRRAPLCTEIYNPRCCVRAHQSRSVAPSSQAYTHMWRRLDHPSSALHPPCSMERACTGYWSLPHHTNRICNHNISSVHWLKKTQF